MFECLYSTLFQSVVGELRDEFRALEDAVASSVPPASRQPKDLRAACWSGALVSTAARCGLIGWRVSLVCQGENQFDYQLFGQTKEANRWARMITTR